ncbi:MAG: CDP-alcohol phosphatidyltransferase family protein [Deltaproteobacteria bacterium]|nr:CDP-alcohol phosphatidyltransferase family protein [Deltaproteobacteria bacterium]
MSTVVYSAWMLVAVGIAVFSRDARWCCAAGALGLIVQNAKARAWRTAAGKLAVANALTLVRLALVTSLPWQLAWMPRWGFVGLVLALLILDGVDGRIARARGETSEVGALFDMETDGLTVMVLSLLLWARESFGPWVLVAGLWRYVFVVVTAIFPALGDVPPSRLYRSIFGVVMVAIACAFAPWRPLAQFAAPFATAALSFSFLHSIARSRALRRP